MNRNIKFFTVLSMLALTVSCSCSKDKDTLPNADKSNVESQAAPTGYVASYPDPVDGALHNAGMGWIALEEQTELGKLDLGASGQIPEVDCIGIQTCWDKLEPKEGEFYWDLVDQTIDYWTARGKRINFRICTDSLSLPEIYYGAPRWLNEEPYNVNYEEYVYSGDMMARVNDLTNPTYQYYFERFISKLAERYANNPYLDTVDIRGYGMYCEWHSGHSFANMEERMFTLAYIIDKYAEAFGKNGISLFLSNSWDYQGGNEDGSTASTFGNCAYEDYLAWSAIDHGMHVEYVSYRRDGMAGNGVTKYSTDEKALYELIRSGKKVANCGEFFGGFDNFKNSLYGMNPEEAINELIFKSRCNYSTVMGWLNSEVARIVEAGQEIVFNRGNQKFGYRFKIDEAEYPRGVKQGKTAHIKTKISDTGVGRFILNNHALALMLVDENGVIHNQVENRDYDLRIMLNGETLNVYTDMAIDNNLADGKYTLAAAIVDANGNPSVRLGQVGNYDDKIYPLGEMMVGNYEELAPFYSSMNYDSAKNYRFLGNSNYEITFEYTPTTTLDEFKFADDDGYEVILNGNDGDKVIATNFQDVSEDKAIKTVTATTGKNKSYSLDINGSGVYKDKISVNKVIIETKTGYIEHFEDNYDLLSTLSPWYSIDGDTAIMCDEEDALHGKGSIRIIGEMPHSATDALALDNTLVEIKPNSNYTISFKTKGYDVGGNGCYYYLKITDGTNTKIINEWYDRPDAPATYMSYTFNTLDSENQYLIFGVMNSGGYLVDDINLVKNYDGVIVKGDNVEDVNNVIPVIEEKLVSGYVEGFEGCVLNDSTFTYGFNRWGHLTTEEDEVISGKVSFSSTIEEITYDVNKNNDWFEFMYSNSKYIKLDANTKYVVKFKYKLMNKIMMNTDRELPGYAYIFVRSSSRAVADCGYANFAGSVEVGRVYDYVFTFTTTDATDFYIGVGIFGNGHMIIDDISVTKKGN